MYTNGSRYPSGSATKRKLENGGADDSGAVPPKQHSYGDAARKKQENYDDSTSRTSPANQHSYGDHMNATSRSAPSKQHTFGDHYSQSSKQHSYGETRSLSKQHSYGDNSVSASRAAQTANQHTYSENMAYSSQQTSRDAAATASKQFMSSSQYSYELMGPPPPPPNQYSHNEKVLMQQYAYKQDASSQSGYPALPYPTGQGRYGQQMAHNGISGQNRGWSQRGRAPMRGFRGNQWPPPGPPPGALVHPHMGHPGHLVPPLLAFGHPPPPPPPPPPRGYFGAHLGPRPHPLFGLQSNQGAGRNQGGHQSHQKSKNRKRQDDVNTSTDSANVVPPKGKGGVLLTPENKPVAKARKRNAVLPPYPTRPWNREDAEKALKVEVETTLNLKNESLIIRFPDPELSRDIVKSYHPGIQNVHFQVPSGPRYCFVQLAPDVNVEKTIKILENIKFGSGHLSVEKKSTKQEEEASPESIDPYTLYIGNLPTNVNIQTVKERFPEAARVDVGFAQRMRYTRYAFIRFNSVDDSIKAYKENHNLVLDSRSIIVRFRRQKGQIDLPGESKPQQPVKVNVRTAETKRKEEEAKHCEAKAVVKDEEDEEDEKDEDEDDDEEDEEENVDDDDDDDDDDGEGEAEDDDDDDDDEEEGRKPLEDDDDDDDDEETTAGPALPPDEDDDDDDDNIFRELDAQLGGYDGFPFNFN